jgi:hypothetical protein
VFSFGSAFGFAHAYARILAGITKTNPTHTEVRATYPPTRGNEEATLTHNLLGGALPDARKNPV